MRTEWIGGCLPSPFYVTDRETPYRPFIAIWPELLSYVILALEMVPPEDRGGALGRALRSALEKPLVGKPRFPPRIRVATDERGACLSILGALGEVRGFALFPSLAAYERFVDAVPDNPTPGQPIDFGTPCLSLYYVAAAELPARMRREATSSGWPVSSPDAYPIVSHRDSDGTLRPLLEHDVRVATACAGALAKMAKRHRRLFALESSHPAPSLGRPPSPRATCAAVPRTNARRTTRPPRSARDEKPMSGPREPRLWGLASAPCSPLRRATGVGCHRTIRTSRHGSEGRHSALSPHHLR